MSVKLMPGSVLPDVLVRLVGAEGSARKVSIRTNGSRPKLIVVYRGGFCPFCQGQLSTLNQKQALLAAAGIDLVAISADKEDVARGTVKDLGLTFSVGYGLEEAEIRNLGLYVSDPTHYIEQTHRFAEPGYFFLLPDNTIQYLTISNHPMGGRVDVDTLLAGYNWSQQNAKENPNFATYIWGRV